MSHGGAKLEGMIAKERGSPGIVPLIAAGRGRTCGSSGATSPVSQRDERAFDDFQDIEGHFAPILIVAVQRDDDETDNYNEMSSYQYANADSDCWVTSNIRKRSCGSGG
jgi:hypothetical protein